MMAGYLIAFYLLVIFAIPALAIPSPEEVEALSELYFGSMSNLANNHVSIYWWEDARPAQYDQDMRALRAHPGPLVTETRPNFHETYRGFDGKLLIYPVPDFLQNKLVQDGIITPQQFLFRLSWIDRWNPSHGRRLGAIKVQGVPRVALDWFLDYFPWRTATQVRQDWRLLVPTIDQQTWVRHRTVKGLGPAPVVGRIGLTQRYLNRFLPTAEVQEADVQERFRDLRQEVYNHLEELAPRIFNPTTIFHEVYVGPNGKLLIAALPRRFESRLREPRTASTAEGASSSEAASTPNMVTPKLTATQTPLLMYYLEPREVEHKPEFAGLAVVENVDRNELQTQFLNKASFHVKLDTVWRHWNPQYPTLSHADQLGAPPDPHTASSSS